MKYIKASNPVKLTEYVVSNTIEYEPAFKWWVKDVLCKKYRIVSNLKAKYWITTRKFGNQVPKAVDEAYKIDQKTGTNFWTKEIEKEVANVHVAFKVFKGATPAQMREGKLKLLFKYVGTHMIFDIKMDGKFTRKARLVAGRHKMAPPSSINYSSVVTR